MRKNYKIYNGNFSLNITSMTDMFTLLLVFLLQSFAATSSEIPSDKNMTLVTSNSKEQLQNQGKIIISKKYIKIADQQINIESNLIPPRAKIEIQEKIKISNLKNYALFIDENTKYAITKELLNILESENIDSIEFINLQK